MAKDPDLKMAVGLQVDTTGATRAIDAVGQSIYGAQSRLGLLGGQMLGGLGGMLAGYASFSALQQAFSYVMKRTEELNKLAEKWDPATASAAAQLSVEQQQNEMLLAQQQAPAAQREIARQREELARTQALGYDPSAAVVAGGGESLSEVKHILSMMSDVESAAFMGDTQAVLQTAPLGTQYGNMALVGSYMMDKLFGGQRELAPEAAESIKPVLERIARNTENRP